MKKDPFNGRPFCSLCGNDFGITNESVEGTFEEAQALIKSGRFDEAIKILNGLDKTKPEVMLMNIYCCYQVSGAEALIDKVSSNSSSVLTLTKRKDVKQLTNKLLPRKNYLMIHILEYCMFGLELSGSDMTGLRAQIKSMKTPSNKRSSVFAKMDEEEEYNAERTRMLQEAANPPEEYPNFGDFLNKPPKVNYGNSWEEPAGTLTGNIVLDIVDFLISEPYDGYNPEMLSHVRRYRAQSHAPKMSDLPKSLEKNVDANKSMTPDDMMDCQRELKTLIRDEERSILNYRR